MAPGDAARLFHRLTSYQPDREWTTAVDHPLVRQGFEANDIERFPFSVKAYPDGLPAVDLPRTWPRVAAPATAVLAGSYAAARPAAIDLDVLGRLLHLSAGVVRTAIRMTRPFLFRAAGSAGARFPLELYLSARGVQGLEDGVHWYDPVRHALVQVGPAAQGAATTLVVTGIPWRTGWRYAERGFRHIYWDGGTMLSQTLALANSSGLAPRLWTRMPDAEVSRLVGAGGVHEFPIALVALAPGEPAIHPRGDATAGAIDAAPFEFPLVTQTQHAGDGDRLGDPWPAAAPLDGRPPPSPDLDEVILQRGSTRFMDPTASVPREVLQWSMAVSMRGSRVPHFIVVHAVEGMQPGVYRWPDLDTPIRTGNLRDELFFVCLDQELGSECSFVVVSAVDAGRLDDCGYREAQLDGGIVEGRLHLAAFARGIGATGMTFLDSEIPALLGEPLAALLFTCVGVPTYRNRAGGAPGSPEEMRRPVRRSTS